MTYEEQQYYERQYYLQQQREQQYREQQRRAAVAADAQRRADAVARIGQIESAMNLIGNYIEQQSKQAAENEWRRQSEAHRARAAAIPAPAPPPANREPTRDEIKRAARAPRPIQISSVIDPLVSSPGSNIRMR
jgi:hypothetical protein